MKDLKGKLGDKVNQEISMVRFMPGDVRIYHGDTFSGVILKNLDLNVLEIKTKMILQSVTYLKSVFLLWMVTYYSTSHSIKEMRKRIWTRKEYINDPLFKNLNAVKNGKAYKVDDVIWNTAGGVIVANLLLDDIEKRFVK